MLAACPPTVKATHGTFPVIIPKAGISSTLTVLSGSSSCKERHFLSLPRQHGSLLGANRPCPMEYPHTVLGCPQGRNLCGTGFKGVSPLNRLPIPWHSTPPTAAAKTDCFHTSWSPAQADMKDGEESFPAGDQAMPPALPRSRRDSRNLPVPFSLWSKQQPTCPQPFRRKSESRITPGSISSDSHPDSTTGLSSGFSSGFSSGPHPDLIRTSSNRKHRASLTASTLNLIITKTDCFHTSWCRCQMA